MTMGVLKNLPSDWNRHIDVAIKAVIQSQSEVFQNTHITNPAALSRLAEKETLR